MFSRSCDAATHNAGCIDAGGDSGPRQGARWYDKQAYGLAARFLDEYEVILTRLAENPLQFPTIRDAIYRAGFRHFPYGLFFRLRDHQVEVFACFHARRDPVRWQRRTA